MDDLNYAENKRLGKTYVSKSLPSFSDSSRKVRIASKVLKSEDDYAFATIKDEIVLRHHEGAKKSIVAKFFEDNRGIFVLSIQGYTVATDKPHNASFAFIGDEIHNLLEFIHNIQSVRFENDRALNISDEDLKRLILSDKQVRSLLNENQDLFTEVLRSEITKEDVVAVGYRKKQLDVYKSLIEDDAYFESLKVKTNSGNEKLWQRYFEKNSWIFGYGLGYVYLSNLDDKKLEQIVQGHNVSTHGKITDAMMKTRGLISSLCFIEIKTHKTSLLEKQPYRSGCWAPSEELVGAVAQVQGTVASALNSLSSKIRLTNNDGFPTGEEAFNYQAKSYLVIGNLSEFIGPNGVNEEKYRSFELYRKNTLNPEIITFDELYERAKYIVQHNQK